MKNFLFVLFLIFLISCSNSNCESYNVDECPKHCVICPPCEVCSSISCHSEEFCEKIGFDKEWYDRTKP